MAKSIADTIKDIAIVFTIAMSFSCTNDVKEVRDFLADKNLPITEAHIFSHLRTDSGRVDMRMRAPIMKDFGNRTEHPYSEFTEGIILTTIDKKLDSVTIEGDYAITYTKTGVSEIRENVVIYNHANKHKLVTSQIYWDKNTNYFFTEKNFVLYTPTDTIPGRGFESDENLQSWWVRNMRNGVINIKE